MVSSTKFASPSRRGTSIASVLLLAVAGCGAAPRPADPPRYTVPLLRLLPQDLEVGSWRRSADPRWLRDPVLPSRTDSAAPHADDTPGGRFQAGVNAAYWLRTAPRALVFVSVMAFAHDDDAFAAHVRRRPPDAALIPIGAGGFRAGTGLLIWKGRYLVFVDAPGLLPPERDGALVVFGRALAGRIPGADAPTGTVAALPRKGLQAETLAWRSGGVFGGAYRGGGVEAAYRFAGANGSGRMAKVFIARVGSKAEAAEAVGRLRREVERRGQPIAELALADQGFKTVVDEGPRLAAFALHGRLVGIAGDLTRDDLSWLSLRIYKALGGKGK